MSCVKIYIICYFHAFVASKDSLSDKCYILSIFFLLPPQFAEPQSVLHIYLPLNF